MTDYNSYELDRKEKLKLALLLALLVLLIGFLFYKSIVPLVALPFLYKPVRSYYENVQVKRRRRKLRNQYRDYLNSVSSSFGAGRHIEEAVGIAFSDLSAMYGPEEAIISELAYLKQQLGIPGVRAGGLLHDFAERSGIEEVSDFAEIYDACLETGGDMAAVLNKCSVMLSEKIRIEAEIETMSAQKKYEGRIIAIMPLVIVVFLNLMSPEYLDVMYSSIIGRIIMTFALAAMAFAYYLVERITAIEV